VANTLKTKVILYRGEILMDDGWLDICIVEKINKARLSQALNVIAP